jgi:Family of unknown function (DUF6535)
MGSILREMQHPGSTVNDSFTAPPYAIRVNCLLFISLFTSMVVALLAILVKQWTRGYQRDLQGVSSPHLLARTRHFRYTGAHHWYFSECVSGLSVIMHFALFIAATGILDLLQAASRTLAYICLTVPAFGAVVFFGTTIIAALAEDAPYRTPLATGVSRILRRAQQFRTPPSKPEDGDGLEDDLLYPDDSARDENVLVRKKHHLDLDIITHLLCQADKSTERGILDDCFRKLPQLVVLSDRSPVVVLDRHEELFKVYRFLSNGCIIEKKNVEEIASNRLERARLLCSFLAWYLSLQRSQQQRERLQWYFNQWRDCYKLPETLGEDPQSQLTSLIPATRAIARLDHLTKQKIDRTECAICDDACEEWRAHYGSVLARTLTPIQQKQLIRDTTALLVSVMDCLVFRANFAYVWDESIAAGSNSMLEILRHGSGLFKLSPTEKNQWETYLNQAKDRAHDPSWIDDVLAVLKL